jgi:hypothetical protein
MTLPFNWTDTIIKEPSRESFRWKKGYSLHSQPRQMNNSHPDTCLGPTPFSSAFLIVCEPLKVLLINSSS